MTQPHSVKTVSRTRRFIVIAPIIALMNVAVCHAPKTSTVQPGNGAPASSPGQSNSVAPSGNAVQANSDVQSNNVQPTVQPDTTLQSALESCAARARRATSGPSNVTGSRAALEGTVHNFGMFSLVVPDSARATVLDTLLGGVTLAWPRCERCSFTLHIQADSGIGLDGRIARIVAEQRRIDSVNHDPNAVAQEFDEIDGPPQPFTTAAGRGFVIDNDCGDCASTTMLWGRPGYVAELSIGGDDDVPELGLHLCEMRAIGKTFNWRGQEP